MNYEKAMSVVMRIFVLGACLLIAWGVLEYAAILFGFSVVNQTHLPGHLIEVGAALIVVVIAILLRQIRDQLRKTS
jgi:TRAP-type C4-dicarboxylate transport system permease small subunit